MKYDSFLGKNHFSAERIFRKNFKLQTEIVNKYQIENVALENSFYDFDSYE